MFDREVFDLPKYTHLLENIPYRNLVRHLPLEHFQKKYPNITETENHFHSLTPKKTANIFQCSRLDHAWHAPSINSHLVFYIHLKKSASLGSMPKNESIEQNSI